MAPIGLNAFEKGLVASRIIAGVDRSGEWLFLVKFKGQGNPEYVRVRDAHRVCPELVIAFYEQNLVWPDDVPVQEIPEGLNVVGFDEGLEAEKILAVGVPAQRLLFVMKWKNIDELSYVRTKEAYLACPQLVIDFYERVAFFPTEAAVLSAQVELCKR